MNAFIFEKNDFEKRLFGQRLTSQRLGAIPV